MKLTMFRSLIALAVFSNTAFASQSAVDYLSTQNISVFDFGIFKVSERQQKNVEFINLEKNTTGTGGASFDDKQERLVLEVNIFSPGNFDSGKDACSYAINITRSSFGIAQGKPILGEGASSVATQFTFAGKKQTNRGMDALASLEKNTVIQCNFWHNQGNLSGWGRLLSTKWHLGQYTD